MTYILGTSWNERVVVVQLVVVVTLLSCCTTTTRNAPLKLPCSSSATCSSSHTAVTLLHYWACSSSQQLIFSTGKFSTTLWLQSFRTTTTINAQKRAPSATCSSSQQLIFPTENVLTTAVTTVVLQSSTRAVWSAATLKYIRPIGMRPIFSHFANGLTFWAIM
jgi:hypothetical protein